MDRYVYCAAIREENDSLPRPPPKLRTVKVEPVDHGYEPQPAKTSKPANQDAALPHRQFLTHNDDSAQRPQENSLFPQRLMNGGVNDRSAGPLGIQERAGIPNAANGGIQNNSTAAAAPNAHAGSGYNPPPTNSANVVPMDSQQNRNRPAMDAEPTAPVNAHEAPAPQPAALLGLLPPHPSFQHAPPQFYGLNTTHKVEGTDGVIERLRTFMKNCEAIKRVNDLEANVEGKDKEIEKLKGAASNLQKLHTETEQAQLQASKRVSNLEKHLKDVNRSNQTTFDQQNNSIFLLNKDIETKNFIIDALQKDKNNLKEEAASHAEEKEKWLKKEAAWNEEKQELNQALEEHGIQKAAEIAEFNEANTLELDNMKEFYENELDKFLKEMEEKKVRELKEMEDKHNSTTTNLQAQIDDWSQKYETAQTKLKNLLATHSTSSERMKVKFASREATGEEHAEEKKAERKRNSDVLISEEIRDMEKNSVVSKEVKTEKRSSTTARRSVQLGRPVSEASDKTSIEHANSLKIRILELNAENKVMSGELRELKRKLSIVGQKSVDHDGPVHKKKKKISEKLIDAKDNGKLEKTKSSEKPSDHQPVDTATNDIRKRGRPPKNSENSGASKPEKMKHFKTPKSG
ncbi:unnamed protein product [Caenorhabditis brenneri]